MSSGAKEVLIKSVAQALPTYIMSVFQLPLALCDSMTSIIREFWWGTENGKRKMAWAAWDTLVQKKVLWWARLQRPPFVQPGPLSQTSMATHRVFGQSMCQSSES